MTLTTEQVIVVILLCISHYYLYRRGFRTGVRAATDRIAKTFGIGEPAKPKPEEKPCQPDENRPKQPQGIEHLPPFVQHLLGPMLADIGMGGIQITKVTKVMIGPDGTHIIGDGFDMPDEENVPREITPVEFNRENAAQALSFAHDVQCPTEKCPIRIFARKRTVVSEEHRCEAVAHAKKHMECCPPHCVGPLNNLIGVLEQHPIGEQYVRQEDFLKAVFPPLEFDK